jgi:hypothetical protein
LPPPVEGAGEHVEQEEESDGDAVPHQVDIEAGLARGLLAREFIGAALIVGLELGVVARVGARLARRLGRGSGLLAGELR